MLNRQWGNLKKGVKIWFEKLPIRILFHPFSVPAVMEPMSRVTHSTGCQVNTGPRREIYFNLYVLYINIL